MSEEILASCNSRSDRNFKKQIVLESEKPNNYLKGKFKFIETYFIIQYNNNFIETRYK